MSLDSPACRSHYLPGGRGWKPGSYASQFVRPAPGLWILHGIPRHRLPFHTSDPVTLPSFGQYFQYCINNNFFLSKKIQFKGNKRVLWKSDKISKIYKERLKYDLLEPLEALVQCNKYLLSMSFVHDKIFLRSLNSSSPVMWEPTQHNQASITWNTLSSLTRTSDVFFFSFEENLHFWDLLIDTTFRRSLEGRICSNYQILTHRWASQV